MTVAGRGETLHRGVAQLSGETVADGTLPGLAFEYLVVVFVNECRDELMDGALARTRFSGGYSLRIGLGCFFREGELDSFMWSDGRITTVDVEGDVGGLFVEPRFLCSAHFVGRKVRWSLVVWEVLINRKIMPILL